MSLKAGTRLRTSTSTVEVLVVRVATTDEVLTCAGGPMTVDAVAGTSTDSDAAVQLGKRYVDDESGLEVLCVKSGGGPLRLGDRQLALQKAKALPASD
ncbi:MAG: hypothetical protein WCE30_09265 [Mycobacterium sp.]